MKKIIIILTIILTTLLACQKIDEENLSEVEILYTMSEESEPHEGTWLQWPHQYQYGIDYRNSLDPSWVEMTRELVSSENVHIIAYNQTEKDRIIALLNASSIPMANVDFKIYKTDDVWVRDNGPIYVKDKNGNLVIQDWGFNGWGNKYDEISGLLLNLQNVISFLQKLQMTKG